MEGDQNQRHAGTKNELQALIKAKQRKEASGKSISQIQASSDGNTHKSKHKLRGGAGKQPEQKQGIKRMPKTRVHSTLCKVPARFQPTFTTQELQFYSLSRELMIFDSVLLHACDHSFDSVLFHACDHCFGNC